MCVGNLGNSHPSSFTNQQQQQEMILDDHTSASLLDVESETPLTFALDTQMLKLPSAREQPSSERGWYKRVIDTALGF